jgi:D-lactate dehydrogenase (cytochrome)
MGKPQFRTRFHTCSVLAAQAGKTKSAQWRPPLDIGLGLIGSGLLGFSLATWMAKPSQLPSRDPCLLDEQPQYGTPEDFKIAIATLEALFDDSAVSTDPDVLYDHGFSVNDYHPGTSLVHLLSTGAKLVAAIPHSIVIYPQSTEDVIQVVKVATAYKMPIIPYSGATSLEGQCRGVRTYSYLGVFNQISHTILSMREAGYVWTCPR